MIAVKKKGKNAGDTAPPEEELARELKRLRSLAREAGESFILRREGEIETIIGHLAAVPAASLKRQAPVWLHEIREMKLKPAKGRLKDLKTIDDLIGMLADQVIAAQDSKGHGHARKG